jgi:hypothetical protein
MPTNRHDLPPDERHQGIQQEVNAKLEPGCSVNFFRRPGDDESATIRYGVVFTYGPRRRVLLQEEEFFDPDRVVKEFNAWRHRVEQERHRDRYTTVPPEEWEP